MRYIYIIIFASIISLFAVSCSKDPGSDDKPNVPSVSIDLTTIDKNTGNPNYYVKAFMESNIDASKYYIGVINLTVDPKTVVKSFDDLPEYINQNLAVKAKLSSWRYNDYYMFAYAFTSDCYAPETNYIGRGFVITDAGEIMWTDKIEFKTLNSK